MDETEVPQYRVVTLKFHMEALATGIGFRLDS